MAFHPAIGVIWRVPTSPAQLAERTTTVRYRGMWPAAGGGASARRAAARDGALLRKRKWARLPRHLRREFPPSPAIYRKQIRPVIVHGADVMDRIFPGQVNPDA